MRFIIIQTYVKTKNSAKETSYQGTAQYFDGKSIGDKDNSTVDKISLHLAVEIGDLSLITRLLSEGADLNATDQHSWTPLRYAVHSGDVDLVRFLRHQGADYDINDCEGPVSDAFRCGSIELVQYFIDEEGIDPMTANELGLTLLGQAVMGGNMDTIEYLLNRKGSTYDGNNLLEIAILCDHLDVVKYLIWKGEVNVNFAEENGWTPLLHAVERDEIEIVWCLIDAGANVNVTTENGTTALHIAAEDGNLEMVECLIENGAKINVRDKKGNTPLRLAIQDSKFQDKRYKEDVKEYLISRGAHI